MSRLPKAIREKILRGEGALTEAEAAAFVGVKTLAEFRRLRRTGLLGDPIPGTTLWNQVELHRSISQLRPSAAEHRLRIVSRPSRPTRSKRKA
jgi:hypothetical protein